jgi:hypothetical protein
MSTQQFQPRLGSKRAAQLFAWADATHEKINSPRPPVEQNSVDKDLAILHSKLNDGEYSKLYTEGQALTNEQAIRYALEVEAVENEGADVQLRETEYSSGVHSTPSKSRNAVSDEVD